MISKLDRILTVVESDDNSVKTYIEKNTDKILSERVSKKGVKLMTVELPKGIKELQLERILSGKEKI